ncbi:thioredoxin family protein [Boudabousia marimammalium]|uniref:Thioredoxin domain-containing protein n=1 Tax=Boudabousia marimammalium TaxID=156892 RepID=A0A1Q5PSW7_9ACTO|nr:thioredoxin family protein [Boudabousia marimammalium]OKL50542.1 hypothetical protein BM477_00810 [Boudabousia marimammalium]
MRKTVMIAMSAAAVLATTLAGCSSADEPKDAMTPDGMTMEKTMEMTMTPESMEKMDKSMTPESMENMDKAMTPDGMMKPASYVKYDEYMGHMDSYMNRDVVLFFNATWCPACRAADEAFKSDMSLIPENATVVSVDYDTHTDLRKKYGVTMQHTFVQVDKDGKALNQWTGTNAADLAKKLSK